MPVRTQAARFVIFVVIVMAHVGLAVLWPGARAARPASSTNENSTTLVFLTRADFVPPPEKSVRPRKVEAVHGANPSTDQPDKSAIDTEAASKRVTRPTDWSRAAQDAIAEQLKSDEDARRRAEGFSQRESGSGGQSDQSAPKPEFGWARWHTERVQALEQGGILIRLNERCAVVVTVIPMVGCSFGKIEARGDLFEHMNDPPTPGDWK